MPAPESSTELHMAEWWLCRSCNHRLLWRLTPAETDDGPVLARPKSLTCPCGEVYVGTEVSPHDTCPAVSWDCPECDEANDILLATEDNVESEDIEVEDDDGEEVTLHVDVHRSEAEILSEQTCRHCGKQANVFPSWITKEEDEDNA